MTDHWENEKLRVLFCGDPAGEIAVLQPVSAEDFGDLETDMPLLHALFPEKDGNDTGKSGRMLVNVSVRDWNRQLAPWEAAPVFGKEGFGDGAATYLEELKNGVIEPIEEKWGKKTWYIAGYSLAGLFALWAATQRDTFHKVAAVSPSVWYPGFLEYIKEHPLQTTAVYLSLGLKEEKTKNPVMATVGDCIRTLDQMLEDGGITHILQWNEGNHFADYEGRMTRGLEWLLAGQPNEG
ncbi:MAG: esterase [Lachnospiraceae bacterium]|nr:esterase [Lachnospiraceae bacterium]